MPCFYIQVHTEEQGMDSRAIRGPDFVCDTTSIYHERGHNPNSKATERNVRLRHRYDIMLEIQHITYTSNNDFGIKVHHMLKHFTIS